MSETATHPYRFSAAVLVLLAATAVSSAAQSTGSNETETVGSNRTTTVGGGQSEARPSKPKEIVVVGSKVKDVVRSQGASLSLQGTIPVEVSDPGRTGLAPGRYAMVLPNRTVRLGDNVRIRLKSYDHRPGSAATELELPAHFEGCDGGARTGDDVDDGLLDIVVASSYDFAVRKPSSVQVRPRPDGGLEVRVPSDEDPTCVLVVLLRPAIQNVR